MRRRSARYAKDRRHIARRAQRPEHRAGSDRIRRRHDRTEHERRGPSHLRREEVHDRGDCDHRHDHQSGREPHDRSEKGAHLAKGDRERTPIEQRRNEDHEQELGIHVGRRQSGRERHSQPAEHEQRWVRNAPFLRENAKRAGDGHQEHQQLEKAHPGALRLLRRAPLDR
jgi:hypothetical protein